MTAKTEEAAERRWRLGAIVYDRFELLDLFGPLEMFGMLPQLDITIVAERAGSVASTQGPAVEVDATFEDAPAFDLLLLPGGIGCREEATNEAMRAFLGERVPAAELTTTVCTGSMILAATGLLDGRRATSNKLAFEWVTEQREAVDWVPEARWVEDGDIFTSSGVAAGIDMSLAAIARLFGAETAERVADLTEYEWHREASWDPFAAKNGLVAS